MTDEDCVVVTEMIEKSKQIASQVANAIRRDVCRRRRMPVAALIGRDDMKSGFREGLHLVAPAMRYVGEPVTEQDGRVRPIARLVHHQLDAIDGDETGGA